MRKRLLAFVTLMALLINLCSTQAQGLVRHKASNDNLKFLCGKYKYQIQENEEDVWLTGMTEEIQEEVLTFPSELDGYKVTGVASGFGYGEEEIKYFHKVKKLIVPDSYEGIDGVGNRFTLLEEIVFGKNIKSIEGYAFDNKTTLKKVTFPAKMNNIRFGEHAFDGCTNLKEVKLPEGMKKIPYKCFNACEKLKRVTFPSTVTFISSYSFSGCYAVKKIDLSHVRVLGDGAFSDCTSLEKVVIPGTVRKQLGGEMESGSPEGSSVDIGKGAFKQCEKLKTVVIKQGVRTIGDDAFLGYLSLKNLSLPKSIRKIGKEAFSDCEKLENVVIKEGTRTIGKKAFWNCSSMKSITIPKSVTKIGEDAVRGYYGKTVIKGYKGSCAEKFAKENNIEFKAL